MPEQASERQPPESGVTPWWQRRYRAILVVIICVGALLRLIHLGQAAQWPLYSKHRLDARYYHQAARYIVERDVGLGRGPLHMSPLYTYLLATTYALAGVEPDTIRGLQLLLGLLTIALVAALGRMVAGHRVSLIAALLVALYRPLIFYEAVLTPATLAAFLFVATLVAFYGARRHPSVQRILLFGFVFGCSIITRPNVLLFAPIAIGGILLDRRFAESWRRRALLAVTATALTAAVIAPVTVRNVVRGDSFVLITDAAGLNFYIGNHRGASGTFEPLFGAANAAAEFVAFEREARKRTGRRMTAAEVSRYWLDEGLREIGRDPAGWLRLVGRKLLFVGLSYEIPNTQSYQFAKLLCPVLRWPLPELGWIFPFALFGLLVAVMRLREAYPLVGAVAAYVGALAAFFVLGHYRLPLVPALAVLAALGVVSASRLLVARRWREGLLALVLISAGFWVSHVQHPLLQRDFSQDYFHLAYAYHVTKRPREAELYYRRALAINPQYVSAHKNLARLAQSEGRRDVAVQHFRAILAIARRRADRELERYARANLRALGEKDPPPAPRL